MIYPVVAGCLVIALLLTSGLDPLLLVIIPVVLLFVYLLDLLGLYLTRYVILHQEWMDFRQAEGFLGGGWLKTRIPYKGVAEVKEDDSQRAVTVGFHPTISGGKLSRHLQWVTFKVEDSANFGLQLRRRVERAKAGSQRMG